MPKTIGALTIIAGACLATLGLPLLFHLLPLVAGVYATVPMALLLAAVAFAMLFAGAFVLQSPRGPRLRISLVLSLVTAVVCCVMGLIFTILVGVVLAYAGVKGYGFLG
jgi:hypothetical protein